MLSSNSSGTGQGLETTGIAFAVLDRVVQSSSDLVAACLNPYVPIAV